LNTAEQFYIEFDGRQLTFTTDVKEVAAFVAETFRHMLAPRANDRSTSLSMLKTRDGYALHTAETIEYPELEISLLLPLIKDEVRLQLMRSRPDLLWLHAGSVERNGQAVLLAGTSGQGKSTITTRLCEIGWRLLSDDISPVRMETDRVVPFPQLPVRRIHTGRDVSADEVFQLERETVSLAAENIVRSDVPIAGVIFIAYSPGADTKIVRLRRGSAALELLRNLTNFIDHKSAAVDRAAALARRLPGYSLQWSDSSDAALKIEQLALRFCT
jgi:hypothetical protein